MDSWNTSLTLAESTVCIGPAFQRSRSSSRSPHPRWHKPNLPSLLSHHSPRLCNSHPSHNGASKTSKRSLRSFWTRRGHSHPRVGIRQRAWGRQCWTGVEEERATLVSRNLWAEG